VDSSGCRKQWEITGGAPTQWLLDGRISAVLLVGLKVVPTTTSQLQTLWLLDGDGASCMLRSHIPPEVVFMYLSEEVAILCLRAAAEPDPKKLSELTERINQLLAEQEKNEPRTRKKAAGA
jgi:hypothetical protein